MIITTYISRNVKLKHLISNDNPINPKSYSSYLLLKNYYRELDEDFSEDWHYYFIIRRHFLRKKKRENGGTHWNCHYCNEPVYKMQERNTNKQEKDCITIDHADPIAKGGNKLNTKNMVECCYSCNQKKADKEYLLFKSK